MTFRSDRLLALRKQAGLTQDELAERSGLSLRTIQRFEKDEVVPDGSSMAKLAAALTVSVGYLAGESTNQNPVIMESDLTDEERELIHALRAKQFKKAFQTFTVLSADGE